MMVLGMLITTQWRVQQRVITTDAGRLRADELAKQLKATEEKLRATEKERDTLAADLDTLKNGGATPQIPERDPNLDLLGANVAAQGPGIIVTLTESTGQNKMPIQDQDLWLVTNELFAAGAEGISINGQRIAAVTGIRSVGQRTMIYQSMTSAPFEVAAIGDSNVLEAALRMRGGVVTTLERLGFKVDIRKSDAITLPAFRVPIFRFAQPVQVAE